MAGICNRFLFILIPALLSFSSVLLVAIVLWQKWFRPTVTKVTVSMYDYGFKATKIVFSVIFIQLPFVILSHCATLAASVHRTTCVWLWKKRQKDEHVVIINDMYVYIKCTFFLVVKQLWLSFSCFKLRDAIFQLCAWFTCSFCAQMV